MYIHEAIAATTPDKPWITRNAWISNRDGRGMDVVIRLMPTEDLFPITVMARSRYGSNSWYPLYPLKQDLMANDWIPISAPCWKTESNVPSLKDAQARAEKQKEERRQQKLATLGICLQILVSVVTALVTLWFFERL